MTVWKLPECDIVVVIRIYGFEDEEEATEEVRLQIENGLDIQGISGTRILTVSPKKRGDEDG